MPLVIASLLLLGEVTLVQQGVTLLPSFRCQIEDLGNLVSRPSQSAAQFSIGQLLRNLDSSVLETNQNVLVVYIEKVQGDKESFSYTGG